MSIAEGYKTNFHTLARAFMNNDACLVEFTDKATGNIVNVICIAQGGKDNRTSLLPLAKMFDGNPYEELIPPEGLTA
jgi:hypothetical protein